MKHPSRFVVAAAALVAAVSFGAFAAGVDLGGPLADGSALGVDFSGAGAAATPPPTNTITVPAATSAVSTTPATVSGTTTGTVTSCAWSDACGSGSCSTGAGTFSCSVAQTQDCAAAQTVSVTCTGPGGSATPATRDIVFPQFQMLAGQTTPNDLSDTLTVNSVSMTLVLACDAQGVSGTSWTCRTNGGSTTLNEAGTGTSPTNTTATPFHASDSTERAARCSGATAKRYEWTQSLGLGTDDFAVEYVGGTGNSTNLTIFGDKNDSTTGAGFKLRQSSSTLNAIFADGVTAQINVGQTNAFQFGTTSTWGHALLFVDRSENSTNGANFYANGAAGTGINASTMSASISGAGNFSICEEPDGGEESQNAHIASFKVWKCTGCMAGGATNPTQWAPIARERASIALGVAPLLAAGGDDPTTMTRSSGAYVDVEEASVRTLYLFGNAAPRVARRGSTTGYLSEPQTTNLCLQSHTYGTTWTATNCTVGSDTTAAPDGSTTADTITNSSTVTPEVSQSVTVSASTLYTGNVFAKAGTGTWVLFNPFSSTTSCGTGTAIDCAMWVDLSTCTLGSTASAGLSQRTVESWGNGWCRIIATGTTIAGATAAPFTIRSVTGDGAVAGTNGATTILWGSELEAFPTSTAYTPTTTATVTRSADDLRFDGATNYTGSPTTMQTDFLCPNFDATATSATFASVGQDGNNYIQERGVAASDRPSSLGIQGGVSQWSITASSGDYADGSAHTIRTTMVTNDIEAFYDGVSFGTDASATLPGGTPFIFFGTQAGSAQQSACLIKNFRLWPRKVPFSEVTP